MEFIIGKSSARGSLLSQENADMIPVVVELLEPSISSGKCIMLIEG